MESNIFTCLSRYIQDATHIDDYSNTSLMYEAMRLRTFYYINIATSAIRLAAAGFYATGNGDETKCYSCGVTHSGWRSMDNPFLIHRRISPNCGFISDTATQSVPQDGSILISVQHSNIPQPLTDNGTSGRHFKQGVNYPQSTSHGIQTAEASIIKQMSPCSPTSVSTCQLMLKEQKDVSHPDAVSPHAVLSTGRHDEINNLASLYFEGAVHPRYSEVNERLKSFETWPVGHCKKPKELALAGFFYAGYSDCVRCYVCGVGLRTWEKEDDPWTEHIRWRSSCDYVNMVKGKDFVIQRLAGIGKESQNATNTSPSTKNQPSNKNSAVDIMDTLECRKALEMGFRCEDVKRKAVAITTEQGQHSLTLDALIERLVLDEDISKSAPLLPGSVPGNPTYHRGNNDGQSEHGPGPSGRSDLGNNPMFLPLTVADSSNESKQCKSGQKNLRLRLSSSEKGVESALIASQKNLPEETFNNTERTNDTKSASLASSAQIIEEENRELKESNLCKVCLDDQANIVFLPCGHLVTCATCSPALARCPICRKHIRGTVRVHLANKDSVQINY